MNLKSRGNKPIKTLGVLWAVGRSNQSILRKYTMNIHWKDWCWSSNTLASWGGEPTHWEGPWCWERLEGKRRRGQQRMRCLDRITDSVDLNLSKLQGSEGHKEAWCAAAHGVTRVGHNLATEPQQANTQQGNLCCFSFNPKETRTSYCLFLFNRRRNWFKLKEIKWCIQGHIANKWQSHTSNSDL